MASLYKYIPPLVAQILVIGLCFFIIYQAVNTKNFKRKSFWIFIIGSIFLLIFLAGFLYDYIKYPGYKFSLEYFSLPIVIFLYNIIISGTLFYKGKKYNMTLGKYKIKVKSINKNFLVLYKFEDFYLLKDEKGKLFLDDLHLKTSSYFYEDEIVELLQEKNINYKTTKHVGVAFKDSKRSKEEYHCYLVELNNLNEYFASFAQIHNTDLVNINADDSIKELIIRIALLQKFEVKI